MSPIRHSLTVMMLAALIPAGLQAQANERGNASRDSRVQDEIVRLELAQATQPPRRDDDGFEPLSELPDNSVEAIYTHHTFEHVVNFMPLLKEIHRVVVPGGRVEVVVPHFSNPYAFSDPTHVRFFGLYTFYYFADEADQPARKVPAHYLPERFGVESINITLMPTLLLFKPVRRLATRVVNSSMWLLDWYERSWCRHFPADSIRYVLRVKK